MGELVGLSAALGEGDANRVQHHIDGGHGADAEEAAQPGLITRHELLHESVEHVASQSHREVERDHKEGADLAADDDQVEASPVVLHFQDNQISKQHTVHVHMVATCPEVECFSILEDSVL